MSKKNYPYQDRSLVDINDEQWEDIPGLDGYFRISSFGRIKRMQREAINSQGILKQYKEMIIAPRVMRTANTYVSDNTYQLSAHLQIEGRKYYLPVRRLVYYCFVKPFDLEDPSIIIVSEKGDGLDIRPENVLAISTKESLKRIVSKKRIVLEFRTPDIHRKGLLASIKITCKQISMYNTRGKKVKTYPSTMEAHRQTGIGHSQIASAATGRERTAGGYFWAYGNSKRFDVAGFIAKRHKSYKEKKGRKVTQYDFNGRRIAQFLTLKDAAAAIGKDYTGIAAALNGITRAAYGYVWREGYGKPTIELKNFEAGEKWRARRRWKKVVQLTNNGKRLREFPSVKEAAKSMSIRPSTLSGALNGKQKTCAGYKWRFA